MFKRLLIFGLLLAAPVVARAEEPDDTRILSQILQARAEILTVDEPPGPAEVASL